MTLQNTLGMFVATLASALVISAVVLLFQNAQPTLASTIQGNEYLATTTGNGANFGSWSTGRLVRTGSGSLAQITVTGANTGMVNIYDATTTNVNNRTNNPATSTILIASLPVSLVAGTYTFDAEYKTGLFVDLVSGTMPTTTITYR